MSQFKWLEYSLLLTFVLSDPLMYGHGFGGNTLVRCNGHWKTIEQIHEWLPKKPTRVKSYYNSHVAVIRGVKSAGSSVTNCYFKIGLAKFFVDEIICTPTQRFWMPKIKKWISAYKLRKGDVLLSDHKKLIPIADIRFVKRPLKVYALEIEGSHNYFVGHHSIITHNMPLPALAAGLAIAFGEGAVAGGAAGSFFGPVTIVDGIAIGGLCGLSIQYFAGSREQPKYYLDFNADEIVKYRNTVDQIENNPKEDDKKVKNDNAQAPGKPTEKDGYEVSKKWNGDKKRHLRTGQYGWPDKSGNLWVPSGPKGHGGPH